MTQAVFSQLRHRADYLGGGRLMRSVLAGGLLALCLACSQAEACARVLLSSDVARAFENADDVVLVEAVSERYAPDPREPGTRVGSGSGRVLKSYKGGHKAGSIVTYRVADGSPAGMSCDRLQYARPGERYKLFLKKPPQGGDPEMLLPSEYEGMVRGR